MWDLETKFKTDDAGFTEVTGVTRVLNNNKNIRSHYSAITFERNFDSDNIKVSLSFKSGNIESNNFAGKKKLQSVFSSKFPDFNIQSCASSQYPAFLNVQNYTATINIKHDQLEQLFECIGDAEVMSCHSQLESRKEALKTCFSDAGMQQEKKKLLQTKEWEMARKEQVLRGIQAFKNM